MLYSLARRLSLAVQNQPRGEYLIREAAMAFTKTMLSLLGFLRFIPLSRFHAKEGEPVIDLSSASVMARQVMEDAISFFYLSEPGITQKQKKLREAAWYFRGAREATESARFGNKSHPDLPAAEAGLNHLLQYFDEPETREMLNSVKGGRKRIIERYKNRVLDDDEILERRGIQTEVYKLGHKVLSNFVHFSELSHRMLMETNADWEKSWKPFVPPTEYVANFAAETIEAFLETFPQTRQLLSEHERTLVANYRSWPPKVAQN